MRLTTQRLTIRPVELKDFERFHKLQNVDFVLNYLCMQKMNEEESLTYIRRMMEKDQDYVLALKDTDELIGKMHVDSDSLRYGVNSAELAYWVGEPYARQGYMSEALHALMAYLFCEKQYDVLTVQVLAPNTASLALMEKLGFTREGTLRHALNWNGVVYDNVCFSMLKEEFHKP